MITPDFPDAQNRYIGALFVKDQINHLRHYFRKIIVICPVLFTFGIVSNDRFCTDYQYDNVSVYYPRCFFIPRIVPILHYRKKLDFDSRPRTIWKCIERNDIRFDLIHAHFTWPSAYSASLIKERIHVPYVVTPHEDPGWLQEEIDLDDPRLKRAWSDASRIMYMNNLEVPKLKKFNLNTISIPIGFDPVYYPQNMQDCRKSLGLPQDAKILFTFGILQKRKGLEYLIEAISILSENHKDIRCYIGGEAQYEKSYESFLKKMVKDLHLEDRVYFLGFLKASEIPLWLNACNLFVLPSLQEGFGIAQIEALACGKPVIAASNSGSMDILTDPDVGILCRRADAEDFARGILEGFSRIWDSEKIIRFADKYKMENISQRLLSVYQEVITSPALPEHDNFSNFSQDIKKE